MLLFKCTEVLIYEVFFALINTNKEDDDDIDTNDKDEDNDTDDE